ncbi:MAG: hypothetical protein IRZ11_06480 [Clostridia bacterium]|nr:hypothetical protein [Clostridia bacterium]
MGGEVFLRFERWTASKAAKTVRTGVASVNQRALAFWRRLSFRVAEEKSLRLGPREATVFVMVKSVVDDSAPSDRTP